MRAPELFYLSAKDFTMDGGGIWPGAGRVIGWYWRSQDNKQTGPFAEKHEALEDALNSSP